ncbi:retrovirus-related pol polyprotein from transposon TNT 1-94 [Tanacetum coccineum]
MATMAENVIAAGKDNGEILIDSIENGPFQLKEEITIPATERSAEIKRTQTLEDLTSEEKLKRSCDTKATNIIILGLPVDIYTLVNHCQTAKEIWDQSQGYAVNTGKSQATGTRVINTVGYVKANQPKAIRCYNCKGDGHIAKQCTAKKRADHVDVFDSDCDGEATANAIFMVRLSLAGSINRDTAGPTYDSELLSEVKRPKPIESPQALLWLRHIVAEFMIIAGADNRPPMLEKSMYDSWKSRMELYINNRENGRMILNSILNVPLVWPTIAQEDDTTRTKKYEELSVSKKLQADCVLKVTNIVLQGLPPDVNAIVNHHKVSKDIWD